MRAYERNDNRLALVDGLAEAGRQAEDCEAEQWDRPNHNPFGGCSCCWVSAMFDLADTLLARWKAERRAARRRGRWLPVSFNLRGRMVLERA